MSLNVTWGADKFTGFCTDKTPCGKHVGIISLTTCAHACTPTPAALNAREGSHLEVYKFQPFEVLQLFSVLDDPTPSVHNHLQMKLQVVARSSINQKAQEASLGGTDVETSFSKGH